MSNPKIEEISPEKRRLLEVMMTALGIPKTLEEMEAIYQESFVRTYALAEELAALFGEELPMAFNHIKAAVEVMNQCLEKEDLEETLLTNRQRIAERAAGGVVGVVSGRESGA